MVHNIHLLEGCDLLERGGLHTHKQARVEFARSWLSDMEKKKKRKKEILGTEDKEFAM